MMTLYPTSPTSWLKFLIPSMIGLGLFVIPISQSNGLTIPVALFAKTFQNLLADCLPTLLISIITLSTLFSILVSALKPTSIKTKSPFLFELFSPSWPWLLIRCFGCLFSWLVYLNADMTVITSGATGGLVFNDLLPLLFCVFIFAGAFLPFLMNFGLLELVSTLLNPIMRPVFKLPGRSAIDCMASFLGDGSVGILMTNQQYELNKYTQKEAAIIATNFSTVSITFSLVVLAQVQLTHLFIPFFMTVCIAGLMAAIIVPRLPPLSRKKNCYLDGSSPTHPSHQRIKKIPLLTTGLTMALNQANTAWCFKTFIKDACKNILDMLFGVIPVIMGIGTIALVISEHTPLFYYLGLPFAPILELFGLPDAHQAANSVLIGFTDMFIPSILIAQSEHDITRFVIAALSLTQLIYLSEVGALILGSKIPLNILELFTIFILRTLVTLPIVVLCAKFIFN